MKNIKYAIDMFIRNPFLIIITIIQISSVIVFVNFTTSVTLMASDTVKIVASIFEDNNFYSIQDRSNEEILFEHTFKQVDAADRLIKFYNYLVDNNEFVFIEYTSSALLVKGSITGDDFYFSLENVFASRLGHTFSRLKSINVGSVFFDVLPYKLHKGNIFNQEDYSSLSINKCILGYEYTNIFNVGDVIELYNSETENIDTVEITGFLQRDSYFLDCSQGLINLDNYIILPMKPIDTSSESIIPEIDHRINQSFIITDNVNKAFDSIQTESNRLNLYTSLRPYNMNQQGTILVSMFKRIINNIMPISIAVFLFSIISLITALLSIIKKRIKEFGVHLLSGATLNVIALRIFYIVILYISISLILAIPLTNIFRKMIFPEFVLPQAVHITIPFILILIFIISIIPVITILTTNINEIIRRKE